MNSFPYLLDGRPATQEKGVPGAEVKAAHHIIESLSGQIENVNIEQFPLFYPIFRSCSKFGKGANR